MSANEIFAAQMWGWPGPMVKRTSGGLVMVVNAAFLQNYGGSIEGWYNRMIEGWPAPHAPGSTNRFESRMTDNVGQEIVYDWIEHVNPDGSALAIARDVTIFATQSAPQAPHMPQAPRMPQAPQVQAPIAPEIVSEHQNIGPTEYIPVSESPETVADMAPIAPAPISDQAISQPISSVTAVVPEALTPETVASETVASETVASEAAAPMAVPFAEAVPTHIQDPVQSPVQNPAPISVEPSIPAQAAIAPPQPSTGPLPPVELVAAQVSLPVSPTPPHDASAPVAAAVGAAMPVAAPAATPASVTPEVDEIETVNKPAHEFGMPEPMSDEDSRAFERRPLPIENGDSVLGNNWRDAVIAKAVGLKGDSAEDEIGDMSGSSHGSDGDGEAASGSQTRILLAEDNAINALLTRTLLEAEGCIVDVVEDGLRAVEAVKKAPYDMVLMDMRMPNMDGLEATRKIRSMNFLAEELPIIALTANAFDDDRNACFDSGMNDFMTKPVSAEELSEMVKTHTQDVIQKKAS